MQKLTITLTAAALALAATAMSASAQTQQLGAGVHAQVQDATPIVKDAACRGWGSHCRPGWVWACGPYGRCSCRPCY